MIYDETLSVSKLKKANLLLSYRIYNKELNKKTFKNRLGISVDQKYKYIGGTFKQKNLYCHDSEKNILTITDIDDDYYKCLNGRPLNVYKPEFKSLKSMLNKRLQILYGIGISKDCILNIQTNYKNETEYYNMSVTRLTDHAKYFDRFILEDYQKSMFLLTQCEKFTAKVDRKIKELQNLAIQLFHVKSILIGLDYKYSIQQKYGRFLYYLSPPSWRKNNREFARSAEIEAKGFDLEKLNEEDTFAVIFDKLRSVAFGMPIKPVIYFKQPCDMIAVFNAMEKQQLYYFTHVNHLAPHAKSLKDSIRVLKMKIYQDFSLFDRLINSLKDLLEFTEKTSAQLENKFFRILYGQFYKSTGTTDVLKLQINLDFCYEKVFLDKPTNMDILSVSKALEKYFLNYSKRLDAIQSSSVRRAMARYAEMEHVKYKNAESAFTELRLFKRLECRLLQSHGLLPHITSVPASQSVGKRNKKISMSNSKIKKKYPLNSAELEYLTLFTEWCENQDPKEYLQGLNIK